MDKYGEYHVTSVNHRDLTLVDVISFQRWIESVSITRLNGAKY